jgi:hypothetical protein
MYYLGYKYFVWPAGDAELRKLEKWLVVARIVGVVFTVFLLAAINTPDFALIFQARCPFRCDLGAGAVAFRLHSRAFSSSLGVLSEGRLP